MKVNNDHCHLILRSLEEDAAIQTKESTVKCWKVKKLLGLPIDQKLKFDTHNDTFCKKAHKKLNTLSRIINCMELRKQHVFIKNY